MSDALEASGRLSEIGMVGILLFFLMSVLFGIGVTVRYLMRRLFDEQNGIITRIATKMITAMDEQTRALQQGVAATQANVVATNKVDSHVVKLGQKLDQTANNMEHFKMIWHRYLKILRAIAKKLGCFEEIESDLSHIEEALDRFSKPVVEDK
jgi:hemoglobin-like flavoprotein